MASAKNSRKVVVLGTGGTIAGTAQSADDNVGYRAAQVGVAQLLASIGGAHDDSGMWAEQVLQIDSKDMDWSHWVVLAQRAAHLLAQPEVQGLLITHGTDTLEETAFFLSQVLPLQYLTAKPVVLTCAMRPSSSAGADGPQNLLDALAVVRTPDAVGVLVVCAGVVHLACNVQKVHTYRLNAFDSGDAGPVGYVEEGQVRWVHGCAQAIATRAEFDISRLRQVVWPRVELVTNCVGASGATVRALCNTPEFPVHGIVVAGTGNGTLHHDLEAALVEVQSLGTRVVRSSRCAYGRVVPGAQTNIPDSMGLPALKARIALVLELLDPAS